MKIRKMMFLLIFFIFYSYETNAQQTCNYSSSVSSTQSGTGSYTWDDLDGSNPYRNGWSYIIYGNTGSTGKAEVNRLKAWADNRPQSAPPVYVSKDLTFHSYASLSPASTPCVGYYPCFRVGVCITHTFNSFSDNGNNGYGNASSSENIDILDTYGSTILNDWANRNIYHRCTNGYYEKCDYTAEPGSTVDTGYVSTPDDFHSITDLTLNHWDQYYGYSMGTIKSIKIEIDLTVSVTNSKYDYVYSDVYAAARAKGEAKQTGQSCTGIYIL